jgi:hypothetical protein
MKRSDIEDFYRELDATDEAFVQRRYATNGYPGWKAKYARQWLEQRAQQRAEARDERVARWTKIGAIAAIVAAVVAAAAFMAGRLTSAAPNALEGVRASILQGNFGLDDEHLVERRAG